MKYLRSRLTRALVDSPVALRDYHIERCHGCLNCQQGNSCEIEDDFRNASAVRKLTRLGDTLRTA